MREVYKELDKFKGIIFDEGPHKYYIDTQCMDLSGTKFVHKFAQEFEAEKIAGFVAKKRNREEDSTERTAELVQAEWKEKARISTDEIGTPFHRYMELLMYEKPNEENYKDFYIRMKKTLEEETNNQIKRKFNNKSNNNSNNKQLLQSKKQNDNTAKTSEQTGATDSKNKKWLLDVLLPLIEEGKLFYDNECVRYLSGLNNNKNINNIDNVNNLNNLDNNIDDKHINNIISKLNINAQLTKKYLDTPDTSDSNKSNTSDSNKQTKQSQKNFYKAVDKYANDVDIGTNRFYPLASEFIVWDKNLYNNKSLAGTIDQLMYNTKDGTIDIVDWKTSKEIVFEGYKDFKTKIPNKMKRPFDKYDDANYYHYSLQLSLYKYIIEKNTNLKIGGMYIVQMSSDIVNEPDKYKESTTTSEKLVADWLGDKITTKYRIYRCIDFKDEIKRYIDHENIDMWF